LTVINGCSDRSGDRDKRQREHHADVSAGSASEMTQRMHKAAENRSGHDIHPLKGRLDGGDVRRPDKNHLKFSAIFRRSDLGFHKS
jgi:hypothetical protein